MPPDPRTSSQTELASLEELLRAWEARGLRWTVIGRLAMSFGLPLARTIIERHGGSISARSGVGDGTVFRISLPLRSHY